MKTFEEFISEEFIDETSVLKHTFDHYKNVIKRHLEPHPNRARRMQSQNLVDKFKLHSKISQDLSVPSGKRRQHAEKAQQYLDTLKQQLSRRAYI